MIEDKFILRCERIQPDVPNINGRVYPGAVIQSMADQVNKKIRIGVFFGRLGISKNPKVRMRDAAFQAVGARRDTDGHLSVDCKILNTVKGVELETMIEALGLGAFEVVPCGLGSTSHRDGVIVIGEDYRLASLDIAPKLVPPKKEEEKSDEAHS